MKLRIELMDANAAVQTIVPILTYHSIDKSGSVISISPENFRAQMKFLHDFGYSVISLKEILTCIQNDRPLPLHSVSITFDDGLKNIYDQAYPVLREFDFSATIFLVAGYCGKNNQWDGQSSSDPSP